MSEIVIATLMKSHGPSGLQSHVRTFDKYLRSVSEPVSIVSPFSARSPFVLPMFAARIAIRRLNRPAGVWWHQYWHAHYLEDALRRHLADRPDAVVYAQCPISAAVALRVRTTQPVVMVAHLNISQADEWADKGEIPRYGALFRSIRSFEQSVLGELDGIVYVSGFNKTELEERIPALREVPGAVVPNPVTDSVTAGKRPEPVADLITVGGLEPRKNHAYLLRILGAAADRGHRYTLSIVGDGPERQSLKALAAELSITNQVRFLGYQPQPRVLMREHQMYCHTSTMESFGIVLVEAMAEGLPVITGAVGGVPDVVQPGTEGLFWPLDDAEAAAGVLIELMEDPGRRERMALAARTRFEQAFAADVVGRRLLTFLRQTRDPQRESLVRGR
ncbi:glycosyltransferase [Kribbella shirazensis]|uniref:Glycosyltransferase involved in cell wall biosynthesis n=1 Tax=Kribbella shirazensis TaxID=1105143 RepID=A0A7X6A455_9ACTN|nr:glycosyltransferase involved in cell wall biosynthesis [Kribbella shirazensis]